MQNLILHVLVEAFNFAPQKWIRSFERILAIKEREKWGTQMWAARRNTHRVSRASSNCGLPH